MTPEPWMEQIIALNDRFAQLAARIQGEVHTDALRRSMLSTDGSIFRRTPAAVVYPRTTADVRAVVRFAADQGLSVHPRGAGSGLCGSALGSGIVLDFSRFMNRLLHLDAEQGWFECQPGYRLGELEAALEGRGLFFPPDPSSGEYATFGGMCSTNASGAHSVKYGNVADYLADAQVVFGDGTVATLAELESIALDRLPGNLRQLARNYREHAPAIESAYPPIACNVAGYNLRGLVQNERLHLHRLLCGAEGTLAVVTRLKFRLIPKPPADSLVVAYFDDIGQAARAVQLTMPLKPSGIEIMDKSLLDLARTFDATLRDRIPGDVDNVLLIEFDGPDPSACGQLAARAVQQLCDADLTRRIYPAATAGEKAGFWAVRKAAVPLLYKLKGRKKILALVEDAAVPVGRLGDYFKGIYAIFGRCGVDFVLYGHIAKGLMHTRPLLDLKAPGDVALLKTLADEVYDLVDGLEGTVSGEHGDGRLRSAYLQRKYPGIYPLFGQTKQLLDPLLILNPEIKKADDPALMTRHLRFGNRYSARELENPNLRWPRTCLAEAEKCHGCSKCTTVTNATRMCPVYKITRDEAAAPKAKANVLRALLSGAVDRRQLYADGLRHVMAQCVNCGSCYAECPSNVDIPKLAMEAKAQYVRRYGAGRADRITAGVELAARLTHAMAPLIAPAVRRPQVRKLAARPTGLAPRRDVVVFAPRSLYQGQPCLLPGPGPAVLYYAGCYAGYIRPELGRAALKVLGHLGFQVHLPPQACCGLPQLSKGMALAARRKVLQNLRGWQNLLDRVEHVVVTCSSCGFALMHDWEGLIPDGRTIDRIRAKTVHISHLLNQHRGRLKINSQAIRLAYHHPCHLRIQPHGGSSLALLAAMPGVDLINLDSSCCGIAGSWGMIAGNYELSRTIGAPMIARLNASGARWGVTDCPTCQMQMEHLGRLPVRHPIEVVADRLA
jgi:FAD/FMN-containing dehydrogenase/Fe-S oxidoreductase